MASPIAEIVEFPTSAGTLDGAQQLTVLVAAVFQSPAATEAKRCPTPLGAERLTNK